MSSDTSRPSGSATSNAASGLQLGSRISGFVASDFVVRAGTGIVSLKGTYTGASTFMGVQFRPGFDIVGGSPDDYGRKIRSEIELWSRIVKDNQIKVE